MVPFYYQIKFQTFFSPEQKPEFYNGDIKINFTCKNDTNRLVLHLKDIELFNETLRLESSTDSSFIQLENFKWVHDTESSFFIAELDSNQGFKSNNNYTFSVSFRGFTRDDNLGFFRSSYLDANNNRRLYI